MTEGKKAAGAKNIGRIILRITLVLAALAVFGRLMVLRNELKEAEAEVAELGTEADIKSRTLEEAIEDASTDADYNELLEAAHDKGYLLPGELIFEDPLNN